MIGLTLVLGLAAPSRADTLHLKDGRIVRGEIVSETEEMVSVKEPIGTSGYAQARYSKTQIERIERAAPASAPPVASASADSRPERTPTADNGSSGAASLSLVQQLATIEVADGYVSSGDEAVARFRDLLGQLAAKFVEDEPDIAKMTANARQMLRESGIHESLLNMMDGMNQVFTERIENQQYAEYIGVYIQLRREGQSHAGAVNGLRRFLQALGVR